MGFPSMGWIGFQRVAEESVHLSDQMKALPLCFSRGVVVVSAAIVFADRINSLYVGETKPSQIDWVLRTRSFLDGGYDSDSAALMS
jgi:hypothetical protein